MVFYCKFFIFSNKFLNFVMAINQLGVFSQIHASCVFSFVHPTFRQCLVFIPTIINQTFLYKLNFLGVSFNITFKKLFQSSPSRPINNALWTLKHCNIFTINMSGLPSFWHRWIIFLPAWVIQGNHFVLALISFISAHRFSIRKKSESCNNVLCIFLLSAHELNSCLECCKLEPLC